MTLFGTIKQRWQARQVARGVARADRGMTLLEIMIVLAIIGLIAGTVGVGLFSRFKSGQSKTAKINVTEIAHAAEQYMMDHSSSCPASLDDLVSSKNLKKKFKDPWGQDFVLRCPGTGDPDGVDVFSKGPDRQEGTTDDVKSWE